MSGLNLRWWRKRPSTHVAEPPPKYNYTQIIDIGIGPRLTGMTSMADILNHAAGLRDITIPGDRQGQFRPGTHVEYGGRHYKVEAVEPRFPDDWFSDELTVTLRDPVNPPVYHWVEDDLLPVDSRRVL